MAAVIGGHFFCLPIADGECWRSIAPMSDSPSSIFRCKICALSLPGEIDTLHGQALYETIKGTVRPAFVFRGKIVVWNLMLMSILMANS